MWAAVSMGGQTLLLTPAWYLGITSAGVEAALMCSLTGAAGAPTCDPTAFGTAFVGALMAATTPVPPANPGGLACTVDEAQAFLAILSDPANLLANLGVFLMTAGTAAQTGVCMLGTL